MADSYFNNVVLLALFDGSHGGTSFTDGSLIPKTLTAVGNAAVSTTAPKIGSGALSLDGMGDCVTIPGATDFVFGTGDFCVDLWVNTSDTNCLLVDFFPDGPWQMMLDASGRLQWYGVLTGAVSVNTGVWVHVAASRNSGTLRLFVDGVADGSADYSTNLSGTNAYLALGAQKTNYNSVYDFSGKMDAVRVTKGRARYTTGFTPPSLSSDYAPPWFATFAGTAPVPTVLAYSGAVVSALSPSVGFYAGDSGTAEIQITAPAPTLTSYSGANLSLTAPSPRLTAQGHDSTGEQAANLTAPSPTLTITTGAVVKAKAPSPKVSATATTTNWVKANVKPPSPIVSATATVSGMASISARAPSPNIVGYGGAVCSVTLTGSPALTSTGTTGSIGGAQITLPLFQATAIATAGNHGSANIVLPSLNMASGGNAAAVSLPSLTLTAIGSAVITATYEAYAVNLKHSDPNANDEITRYTNFPFTHVVRYQNSYYGANSTGLYLLEGTTDNGAPIPWAFETAITDFKSPNKKTLAAAYFSGRFGTSSTIQLKKGEKSPITHAFTTPRGTLAQNHRQVFGKDRAETRTRYFALAASGTSEFELDSIECDVHNTTRRI